MSPNEIILLSVLGAFGILAGSVGGIIASRRGKELIVAVGSSALFAAVVPLMFWFAWTTIDAIIVHGYSFGRALSAGFGALFLLAFSVPFVTGLPAVISAVISYYVARRCRLGRIAEQDVTPNA